jgi:membrane-bound ClpP family serine protease
MMQTQTAKKVRMWVVAGVLLGLVILSSLTGFHTGPHAHVVAGVAGVLAAAWIVFMLADGRSGPLLWALLGADVVVAAGMSVTAWKGLTARSTLGHHLTALESAEGVAVSDLEPGGIVRVRGEQWSALAVNGTVRAGGRIQVLRAEGVRLEVWGEETEAGTTEEITSLDSGERKEQRA